MDTVIVAAVAGNGVIGVNNELPWRIPEDLARFKKLTMGHTLIMGRATFESIGRPLGGRSTIVLTRNEAWHADGVSTAPSLAAAVARAHASGQVAYICGGAEVYREALDVATAMEITEVDQQPVGDTAFPEVDWSMWDEVGREPHSGFSFVSYRRSR